MECKICKREMTPEIEQINDDIDYHWAHVYYTCNNCGYSYTEHSAYDLWKDKYGVKSTGEILKIKISKENIEFVRGSLYGNGTYRSFSNKYKTTKDRVWRVLQASSKYHHYTA